MKCEEVTAMETCTVNLVYTTDVHGQLTPYNFANRGRTSKGLSRLKTYLDRMTGERILIDGGDILQGSPLVDQWIHHPERGTCPVATVLNHLGYDYVTIGNHEFNYGREILDAYVGALGAKVLCGNIYRGGRQVYPAYAIRMLPCGVRLGIVGAVTQAVPGWEKPSNIRNMTFEDAYESIRKNVEDIRDKVDAVVVLYHGGIEKDLPTGLPVGPKTSENEGYKIARNIGAEVVLTGHQHRNIADAVGGTCIVQVADQASAFALVQMTFDKEDGVWRHRKSEAATKSLADIPSDEGTEALVADLARETDLELDRVLLHLAGTSLVVDDPFLARRDNHPIFELVNRAQLWASGAMLSSASLPNMVPGLRSQVTMRDIAATFIYPNSLCVLEIDGSVLKAALEKSAEYFAVDADGNVIINPSHFRPKIEHYNYDVFAGVSYRIDVAKPQGFRVANVRYAGKPVKDDQFFTIALNNYRAGGGGQYDMFKDAKLVKEITSTTADIVVEYLITHPEVRITKPKYPVIETSTVRK